MGICKLTGKNGKFVKSHIIPKALTRPNTPGNKFIQPDPLTKNKRYLIRPDSWYDKSIVIREGEDYLSNLDSYAIDELRTLGLLWSSEKMRQSASNSSHDITVVEFKDSYKIRLYFLSLLWRASVSSLPELQEIKLPAEQIERLRQIIICEVDDDLSFFPITLVQLLNKGPTHNFIPIKLKIRSEGIEIYRFYMDGLIAHIHLSDPKLATLLSRIPTEHPMFVGNEKTIITQVETSVSFQMNNLAKHIKDFAKNHANVLE